MGKNAVEFEKVNHYYHDHQALKDVSFQIPRGSILGLIGPNGSGKTTTLNILTGLLAPTEGTVHVGDVDVRSNPNEVKRFLGYAPEEVALFDGLSAREFVILSAELHHMETQAGSQAATEILRRLELHDRENDQLGSFSKGMRRKALIASALVHDPEILVLDEPLEGLDVVAQAILKDLIREHAARGRTVIYSTHILEVLQGFCTHLLLLRQGELLSSGSVEEVQTCLDIEHLAEAFLGKGRTRT